jgi:hypothetical protein
MVIDVGAGGGWVTGVSRLGWIVQSEGMKYDRAEADGWILRQSEPEVEMEIIDGMR